jgi:hypothetical protein
MYLQNYLVGKMVMGDEKAIFDAMSAMPVMLSCGINTQVTSRGPFYLVRDRHV